MTSTSWEVALIWMPKSTFDKSSLVQVIAWCCLFIWFHLLFKPIVVYSGLSELTPAIAHSPHVALVEGFCQPWRWHHQSIEMLFTFNSLTHGKVTTVMSLLEVPCAKTSWRVLLFCAILGITGAFIVCFDIWRFKQVNNSETGFGGHHCDFEQHVLC